MYGDEDIEQLAAAAHGLWCSRQRAKGWTSGPGFDQPRRVHDALVPFERLGPLDRRNALLTASSFADQLVAAIDYARGPDREFLASEVREGLRVGWAFGCQRASSPHTAATEVGTIVGWEGEEAGPFLRSIRVRWPGGEETEHNPALRDLRRL